MPTGGKRNIFEEIDFSDIRHVISLFHFTEDQFIIEGKDKR